MTTCGSQPGSFLRAYVADLCESLGNDYRDNFDENRFGKLSNNGLRSRVRDWGRRRLNALGLERVSTSQRLVQSAMALVEPALPRFESLYQTLSDDGSRALLVKLVTYRALGHRRVKLPVNTPAYWNALARYESMVDPSQAIASTFGDSQLFLMDFSGIQVPLRMYSLPICATTFFDLHQYRCDQPFVVDVSPGDYVIDGGGCWGDAALIFAWKAGKMGKVFSFEFVPANLHIFRKNLCLNPAISDRIGITECALWHTSGEILDYDEGGPATTVKQRSSNGARATVPTVTIDDFCRANKVERVDFIKLDIEGSELSVLRGAVQTLRQFKPKLAICVYHKLEDFYEIPDFIRSLDLGYRFTIGHHTIHAEETVLYAKA